MKILNTTELNSALRIARSLIDGSVQLTSIGAGLFVEANAAKRLARALIQIDEGQGKHPVVNCDIDIQRLNALLDRIDRQEAAEAGSDSQPFKVGDVVRLKSGGTFMTVASLGRPDSSIRCEWFSNCCHSAYYHRDQLEVVETFDLKQRKVKEAARIVIGEGGLSFFTSSECFVCGDPPTAFLSDNHAYCIDCSSLGPYPSNPQPSNG